MNATRKQIGTMLAVGIAGIHVQQVVNDLVLESMRSLGGNFDADQWRATEVLPSDADAGQRPNRHNDYKRHGSEKSGALLNFVHLALKDGSEGEHCAGSFFAQKSQAQSAWPLRVEVPAVAVIIRREHGAVIPAARGEHCRQNDKNNPEHAQW